MLRKNAALLLLFTSLLTPSCKQIYFHVVKKNLSIILSTVGALKFLYISHRQLNLLIFQVWGVNWRVGSEITKLHSSFWWEDSEWWCCQAQPFTHQVPSLLTSSSVEADNLVPVVVIATSQWAVILFIYYILLYIMFGFFLSMSLFSMVHLMIPL